MLKTIKDFLTLKRDLKENLNKTVINDFLNVASTAIINQVETDCSGAEKKAKVDEFLIGFIKNSVKTNNGIVVFLANMLCEYLPVITQCIYNFLKEKVKGLTKEV